MASIDAEAASKTSVFVVFMSSSLGPTSFRRQDLEEFFVRIYRLNLNNLFGVRL
jgi:hypothetical protein